MPTIAHNSPRFSANASTCLKCSEKRNCLGKCPEDGKGIELHADSGWCPIGLLTVKGTKPQEWDSLPEGIASPAPEPIDLTPQFHALWREFHAAPRSGFLAFLTDFIPRIPCGACRDDTVQWVADHPPDLSSDDALDRWKNALHNAVNRKLGKPEMSIEDARKIHNPAP